MLNANWILKLMVYIAINASLEMFARGDKRYFKRLDMKIQSENVTSLTKARSHVHCTSFCSSDPACLTASYRGSDDTCLLSTTETLHDEWDKPRPEYLEITSGWTSTSRITLPRLSNINDFAGNFTCQPINNIFSVVHIVHTPSRHSLSFAQAQQVCVDLGATLASPADLLEARSLGYDFCGCGWLSDGTNGMVKLAADGNCFYSWHTGVVICDYSTADAYCKVYM